MTYNYIGSELDVFAHAVKWKTYLANHLHKYLRGDVLEVGAGIGSVTRSFRNGNQRRWVCLEPDKELSMRAQMSQAKNMAGCEFVVGTVKDLPADETFDSIIYIDVLEHIENDRSELARAAAHLKPGGTLCVLAPAHQWLFTKFDARIGHFRRYGKSTLAALGPPHLRLETLQYLDTCGLIASAGNRFILRLGDPTVRQIIFWDRVLVSFSKLLDRLLGFRLGKSVLAVWRRPEGGKIPRMPN